MTSRMIMLNPYAAVVQVYCLPYDNIVIVAQLGRTSNVGIEFPCSY
jgi:hypothetical protein